MKNCIKHLTQRNRKFCYRNQQRQMLGFFMALFVINVVQAQTVKTKKIDTIKVEKNNFMDMQAKTLTSVFGENLDGESTGKSIGFLEVLQKMDIPAEQKAEYKNWYYLQSRNLTEKQKDSLGKALHKKIAEAPKDQ